ncbi:MAG: tetratricopeptide (TPR) repeat protein [Crocinitomicaceae bacterium]|jgi:tetratricopeptide (TPR) repeat protein
MFRILFVLFLSFLSLNSFSADAELKEDARAAHVNSLEKPLYSPFIERYVLDELKQLRTDQASTKNELIQQILDRELNSVDRGVAYATDTITYFFYLIAAATSVLVLVGWTSIRDIKERVHSLADEEISHLVKEYETRLENIESLLKLKAQNIEENREEIELTQELQSLWLRAQQEPSAANKISIYDEIIKLKYNDCEALTYKADAVLELNEPQWAANLCHQALKIDQENSHAFYQLACAYTAMNQMEEAITYLKEALNRRDSYLEDIKEDPALTALVSHELFRDFSLELETK